MNPQIRLVIDAIRAATPPNAPRFWDLGPAAARQAADAFFLGFNRGGPEMAEVRSIEIPGRLGTIPARLYVPHEAALPSTAPCIFYLHGGGFVIGNPASYDRLTRELAAGSAARVVSLDYGLAPEHPYPEGLDDCVAAARWLADQHGGLGIDPDRLVIAGDSAGATLSAATVLRLGAEGWTNGFRAALLIYGQFTLAETPSMRAWGERDLVLSRRVMEWFRSHYLGSNPPTGDPYVQPLLADLSGFPPSILVVGTLDPLLSDSQLFAAALEKAGVPAELHVYEDGIHAFVQMTMLDIARDAVAKLCAFVRRSCA